jgi:hypothetical protein
MLFKTKIKNSLKALKKFVINYFVRINTNNKIMYKKMKILNQKAQ